MVDQQGRSANISGRDLENEVEDRLNRFGFVLLDDETKKRFAKGMLDIGQLPLDKCFMRNVKKYEGIYGVRLFADFVVYDKDHFPRGLVVEVKTQNRAGSVDEKYVYTVMSLERMHRDHGVTTWLVFSGSGIRECAMRWMRKKESAHFKVMDENRMRRALSALYNH